MPCVPVAVLRAHKLRREDELVAGGAARDPELSREVPGVEFSILNFQS